MKKYEFVILLSFSLIILSALFSLDFKYTKIVHKDIRWRPIKSHYIIDSYYCAKHHDINYFRYEVIDSSVWDTFPDFKK